MLSLILDVAVLVGLGFTIYYCIRLSKSLNNFRQYRQEFNTLLQELSRNIGKAQDAIENLKDSSYEAGEDLQKVINSSRNLADELQLMNDMGNALANRLERLSDKGRDQVNDTGRKPLSEKAPSKASKVQEKESAPSFFIQDREFDRDEASYDDESDFMDEDGDDTGEFQSKAERELYEALQKNVKGKSF